MVWMLAQPLALMLALMLAHALAHALARVLSSCQHYCRKPRDARGLAAPLARACRPRRQRAPRDEKHGPARTVQEDLSAFDGLTGRRRQTGSASGRQHPPGHPRTYCTLLDGCNVAIENGDFKIALQKMSLLPCFFAASASSDE